MMNAKESMMLTVVMDSIKKTRGNDEYRYVPRVSALGVEVVGDGAILSRLLADLVAAGKVERSAKVKCLRNGMSVFAASTVVNDFITDPSRAKAWKPWAARNKAA